MKLTLGWIMVILALLIGSSVMASGGLSDEGKEQDAAIGDKSYSREDRQTPDYTSYQDPNRCNLEEGKYNGCIFTIAVLGKGYTQEGREVLIIQPYVCSQYTYYETRDEWREYTASGVQYPCKYYPYLVVNADWLEHNLKPFYKTERDEHIDDDSRPI